MDTNRIRYFLSLARTESVTKAAELHRISPAAFSKAMRVFEAEVGIPVTVPNGRGIQLTDQARRLVPTLTEVIRQLDTVTGARTRAQLAAGETPSLRLATFEVFSTYFLEKTLHDSFEGFTGEIHEMTPGRMEQAVVSRTVDLGLTYLPIPHPELDFLRIAPIAMGLYGHHAAKTTRDVRELPFVVPLSPLEGTPTRVQGLDGWPDDGFPRNIRYRVELLETALGLCRRELAFAYLPCFIARIHNEVVKPAFALKEFEMPASIKKRGQYVYLIKRKADVEGAAAKKIAKAVRQLCAER